MHNEMKLDIQGFVEIFDKETGLLLEKRNAIHYGNMAYMVAQALTGNTDATLYYMAIGNGATSVSTTGKIVYKPPRVTEAYEAGATLYSRTYEKRIDADNGDDTSGIRVIPGQSFSDIKVTCTLNYNEPTENEGAQPFDNSLDNNGLYVFDEMALFTKPVDSNLEEPINSSTMLTHVIFHPVQKSLNRVIEIVYTLRVQLS
jgi:hypothetical protein